MDHHVNLASSVDQIQPEIEKLLPASFGDKVDFT